MNDEQDITERLRRLAQGVQTGSVEPDADVRRGRARLRRRQTLAAVASAAAVVGVAGGIAAFAAGGGTRSITPADGRTPGVPVSVSTSAPTGSASCAAATPKRIPSTSAGSPLATATILTGPGSALHQMDDALENPTIRDALTSYATILASHLDPTSRSLQTTPTGFTGDPVLSCGPNSHVELGTKLSWKDPGMPGEAMVYVSVTDDWADDQIHMAFDDWKLSAYPPDQVARAWVAANGRAVAVEHLDGTVVAIQTDQLFGNDSTVRVAGFGFTPTELLAAAADSRFQLPH